MINEASLFQAIASPRRREILRLVWSGERSAGEIYRTMPDVTFGAVSLHLGALAKAGLVSVRQEKQSRLYRAVREQLGPVGKMLEAMWDDALWKLKLMAELEETRRGPRPVCRKPDKAKPDKAKPDKAKHKVKHQRERK
jgi:DNA-binding transcriptional ArsR family regulator